MDPPTKPQEREGETSAAFARVFRAEYSYVWHSLRRLGVAERDADDMANEVFVRVHQRFSSYDVSRPVRPWLFAFAARVASDYRRLARHRREQIGEPDSEPKLPAAAERELERSDDRALLARALDHLDDDKRAVVVAHDLDELAAPEIARALEIPLPTVYTRLRNGRLELAAVVRRLRAGAKP